MGLDLSGASGVSSKEDSSTKRLSLEEGIFTNISIYTENYVVHTAQGECFPIPSERATRKILEITPRGQVLLKNLKVYGARTFDGDVFLDITDDLPVQDRILARELLYRIHCKREHKDAPVTRPYGAGY